MFRAKAALGAKKAEKAAKKAEDLEAKKKDPVQREKMLTSDAKRVLGVFSLVVQQGRHIIMSTEAGGLWA
eukprot:3722411-Pyramimonas_sp.AAC.1